MAEQVARPTTSEDQWPDFPLRKLLVSVWPPENNRCRDDCHKNRRYRQARHPRLWPTTAADPPWSQYQSGYPASAIPRQEATPKLSQRSNSGVRPWKAESRLEVRRPTTQALPFTSLHPPIAADVQHRRKGCAEARPCLKELICGAAFQSPRAAPRLATSRRCLSRLDQSPAPAVLRISAQAMPATEFATSNTPHEMSVALSAPFNHLLHIAPVLSAREERYLEYPQISLFSPIAPFRDLPRLS